MIEPSKSTFDEGYEQRPRRRLRTNPKGDQLTFCCDFRYLNSVTMKDVNPIPMIDESLSKLGDAKYFATLDLGSAFWQVPLRKQHGTRRALHASWDCFNGKGCPLAFAMRQPPSNE